MPLKYTPHSLKDALLSQDITTLEKNPDDSSKESIELKFDKVSFDHLMKLLITFWQTYKINITQLSVIRTKEAGIVQVNLVLNLPE